MQERMESRRKMFIEIIGEKIVIFGTLVDGIGDNKITPIRLEDMLDEGSFVF